MLLECQNCGAPLDVAGTKTAVRCNYCGKMSEVKAARTVAPETPQGWQPPASWTPPPERHLPDVSLPYRAAGRAIAKIIGLVGLCITVIIGAVVWRIVSAVTEATAPLSTLGNPNNVEQVLNQAMGAINKATAAAAAAGQAAQAAGAAGTLPTVCGGNDTVTLNGQVLTLSTGVPVTARDNCKVRLVACTATGVTAVVASGNARVTVEGGMLTGTGPAVLLSGNAVLEAQGAALVGEPAISASGNARARLSGSRITGTRIAVQTSVNATVDTTGSVVQGQVVGARRVKR